MNAKELKLWLSKHEPDIRQHINNVMPPPGHGSTEKQEVERWYNAALNRQGLKDAREWGGTAEALAYLLYRHLDVLLGYAKASDHPVDTESKGETKVTDPENTPTENESAAPESFPVFPESPVVVYPSDRPSVIYEMPDGTSVGFSVTLRLGGTAEMALELIGQFVALFDQYGLKPGHGVVVMGKQPQAAPPPPAQPARPTPANAPPVAAQPKASPFGVAQPKPAAAAASGEADGRGNVPGEMKVNPVEFVTFNDANGKKNIELWIKGMEFPVRLDRGDQMQQVVDFLSQNGLMDFSTPPQLGAKYPLAGVRINRTVGTNKTKAGNYYLNFHSLELGGASASPSDLPF